MPRKEPGYIPVFLLLVLTGLLRDRSMRKANVVSWLEATSRGGLWRHSLGNTFFRGLRLLPAASLRGLFPPVFRRKKKVRNGEVLPARTLVRDEFETRLQDDFSCRSSVSVRAVKQAPKLQTLQLVPSRTLLHERDFVLHLPRPVNSVTVCPLHSKSCHVTPPVTCHACHASCHASWILPCVNVKTILA